MSIPLNTIYSYFETGDFPTEEQFQASWSSFWHKDESIPTNKIAGLETQLQNKADKNIFETHVSNPDSHANYLAKKDASNLDNVNVQAWKSTLGVGELPENIATVDDANNTGNVYTKNQSDSRYMFLDDFVNDDEKILAEKIEALGLTTLIESVETTISEFANHSNSYEFEDNDFIAIPDNNGNYSLFMFKGGIKTDKKNYLPTGISNVTMGMVEGLQAALNGKMDKPTAAGNYIISLINGVINWKAVNPASNYLLSWDGGDFKESNIYYNASKLGIGTTSPTEMFHLNNGRIRSKGVVFDDNPESLPYQITHSGRRYHGSDLTGNKRMFMYRDYSDYLTLINELSYAEKEAIGKAWNDQYSNGSLNVYNITPPIIKNDHAVKYLVLGGINLNINPATTSVHFIPEGNVIGTGEIDCLGFQTFANGQSIIVTTYGDSLSHDVNYNVVIRTTAPTIQIHRTTTAIIVSSLVNGVDLSSITWQKKIYNNAINDEVFGSAGAAQYQSSASVKAYTNEATIVSALKSSQIISANQDFYLNFDVTINFTSPSSTLPSHYIGLMPSNTTLDLINTTVANVRIVGRGDSHIRQIYLDNSSIYAATSATNPDTFNYTIMRRGSTVYFILTKNGVVQNYNKSITNQSLSFALFAANMGVPVILSTNITELVLF